MAQTRNPPGMARGYPGLRSWGGGLTMHADAVHRFGDAALGLKASIEQASQAVRDFGSAFEALGVALGAHEVYVGHFPGGIAAVLCRNYEREHGRRCPGSWRTRRLRKKRLKALGVW